MESNLALNVVLLADGGLTHDIQVNLIASVLASAITYIAVAVLRFRIPSAGYLLFWRKFARDLIIIISEIDVPYDPNVKRGEQPPLTPMGDAMVLGEFLLYSWLYEVSRDRVVGR